MAQDKFDLLASIFDKIGAEIILLSNNGPENAILYAEQGDGWLDPNLFINDGDNIRYVEIVSEPISNLLLDAWYAEEEDKRWGTLEYWIRDGQYEISLKFPDEVELDDLRAASKRREVVAKRHFGDKPIVYPTFEDDDDVFDMRP